MKKEQEFRRRFQRRVLVPGVAIFLFTVALCGFGLYSAGKGVDDLSMEGQTYEAWRAMGRGLDELSLAQETLGTCKSCAGFGFETENNQAWYQHIAQKMSELYDVDRTYVLDGADRPVFAAQGAESRDSTEFANLAETLMPFVDRVRGREVRPNNWNERLPGVEELPEFSSVRTSEEAVHSTDLAMIEGRPALVSAMRMTTGSSQAPVLVNARFLDGGFLADVSSQNFIMEPRLAAEVDLAEGEKFVPITTSQMEPLTNLIWKPLLPGSLLVGSLLPWAIFAVIVIGAMLMWMGVELRKMMRKDAEHVRSMEQTQAELQAKEAQAHRLAYHDQLTDLPNRAKFNDHADRALIRSRHGKEVAIMLLDLDRFKFVNDRFGHLAGDALIKEVGQRLTAELEGDEMVARLGGDEFAMMIYPGKDQERLDAVIATILHSLSQPFMLMGNQAHVSASIGVALAPASGTERTELLRKADIALYRAKAEGRNCHRHFTDEMDESVHLRAELEADLREAIESGEGLEVHYQPQVDPIRDQIVGIEALMRWNHPTRGPIPPAIFIPIAEETGLISVIGDWVLQEACKVARTRTDLTVAVNLSPAQFHDTDLADRIEQIVRAQGVEPHQIELEVTESVVLDQNESVRGTLIQLRKTGFRIALDDFGTGYSSLSCLREFEVDKIKIDKSFVHSLGNSNDADAIVTAVTSLGHAMGLHVTAEGVETLAQQEFLRGIGCEQLQGFLFAKALPFTDSTKEEAGGEGMIGFLQNWDRRKSLHSALDKKLRMAS